MSVDQPGGPTEQPGGPTETPVTPTEPPFTPAEAPVTPPTDTGVSPGGEDGVVPPNPDYSVRLEVDYPPKLSRLLIFVKGLLLIPHFIALLVVGIVAFVYVVVAFFTVLFTGKYPEGAFKFVTGTMRWGIRVFGYWFLMTDKYPPFTLEDDPSYPVRVEFDYPEKIANWRALLNFLIGYPAAIAAGVIMYGAYVCVILAWFGILFTGRYPKGLFKFNVIALRWQMRTYFFQYFMTEKYPPFVWQ